MDPQDPTYDSRRYKSSGMSRNRQQDQEGYWDVESDLDSEIHYVPEYDPQLQNYHSEPRETILPPGTSISNSGGYRPSGSGYASSSQPFFGEDPGQNYGIYQFGDHNAASSYTYGYENDQERSDLFPDRDRTRPVKRYHCEVSDCPRKERGNGFTTLNDLERHGRSKHGEDGQYIECRHQECPDHGKRFPRRDNFIDHYCRVHSQGQPKDVVRQQAAEFAKKWMMTKKAGSWTDR